MTGNMVMEGFDVTWLPMMGTPSQDNAILQTGEKETRIILNPGQIFILRDDPSSGRDLLRNHPATNTLPKVECCIALDELIMQVYELLREFPRRDLVKYFNLLIDREILTPQRCKKQLCYEYKALTG
ncbi:hypothetical protein CHS0354_009198 [Potamilus streckersoni]|uniref:Uncharacterized protein n=1 Tax=Potamilus streckersoni TaxID=2493646 RepID=A0AAE0SYZ6_9BIVA|nr:hypothetical protein CHS0354_009198 [Potamilus streckersoni]